MADKVAIVTGAGQGIGRAIALRLARDGFGIVVNDISADNAETTRAEIEALGGRSVTVVADISDRAQAFMLVESACDQLSRVDVMVANAGVIHMTPLIEESPEQLQRIFSINVFGTLWCWQAAAEVMIRQGTGGRIISASSIAGHQGMPTAGAYSATKHAVVGMTQTAAKEWGPHNILVNSYCPGIVDTDMWNTIGRETGTDKTQALDGWLERIALGRIQTPDDVAGLVSYLASPDSGYLTGQSINVDGGILFQ